MRQGVDASGASHGSSKWYAQTYALMYSEEVFYEICRNYSRIEASWQHTPCSSFHVLASTSHVAEICARETSIRKVQILLCNLEVA